MLQVGQVVGNYRVVRPIGQGGMGAVFEAVHQYIGHRAAIKVLYPEYSQNPHFVSRFMNEARAVKLVQHPGLVEVAEFGFLPDGTAYIVMEYLDGESLTRRIARKGRSWDQGDLELLRQIAQALQAAHDRGIIHRDLKPDNVIIVADPERPGKERVKVLDFGIAKLADQHLGPTSARFKTQTGVLIGTPHYMSPEQCSMEGTFDGKVDVYALGIIAFEMLTGRLPFTADLAAAIQVMHVYNPPPQIRELDPSIPVALATLVHAMLAKAPAARPTMGQVAERLQRLPAASSPAGEQTVTLDSRQILAVAEAEAVPPGSAMPTRPAPALRLRRTARMALVLGGAGLVVLLMVHGLKRRGGITAAQGTRPVAGADLPDAGVLDLSTPVAVCSLTSTPERAQVLRAADKVLLGETPWRMEQPSGVVGMDVLVRRDQFAEQRVTLDWGSDCTRQVTLVALARPVTRVPPRRDVKQPSQLQRPQPTPPHVPFRQGNSNGSPVKIPIIH